MFDWGAGYEPEYRLHHVVRSTFADGPRVARVDSAKLERVRGGLLESGTLAATRDVGEAFEEGYYRLVMVASQGTGAERVELATLYCTSASGETRRGADLVEVEGRSVLYPASVRRLLDGTYAPKGADGAAEAARMLRECVAAPVEVEGSFTLGSHVVFDLGTTYLDAAWTVLDAGGFCMQVDGHGTVHVRPTPSEPSLVLDAATGARLMEPGVSHALDFSSVPNVYAVDDGGMTARAVNDDPGSPTSTVARGYEHTMLDTSPVPVSGETLAAYARRKLMEASTVDDERSYTREYYPGVFPYSVVRASMSRAGVDGTFRVSKQTIEIGHGAKVAETVVREVKTWTA